MVGPLRLQQKPKSHAADFDCAGCVPQCHRVPGKPFRSPHSQYFVPWAGPCRRGTSSGRRMSNVASRSSRRRRRRWMGPWPGLAGTPGNPTAPRSVPVRVARPPPPPPGPHALYGPAGAGSHSPGGWADGLPRPRPDGPHLPRLSHATAGGRSALRGRVR